MKFTVFLLFACFATCFAASYREQTWGNVCSGKTVGVVRVEKKSSLFRVQKNLLTFPKVKKCILNAFENQIKTQYFFVIF